LIRLFSVSTEVLPLRDSNSERFFDSPKSDCFYGSFVNIMYSRIYKLVNWAIT